MKIKGKKMIYEILHKCQLNFGVIHSVVLTSFWQVRCFSWEMVSSSSIWCSWSWSCPISWELACEAWFMWELSFFRYWMSSSAFNSCRKRNQYTVQDRLKRSLPSNQSPWQLVWKNACSSYMNTCTVWIEIQVRKKCQVHGVFYF